MTALLARPLTSFHLLLSVFGLLVLIGLVMVLSASTVASFANNGSSYSVFAKQLIYVAVGLVLFWMVLRLPPTVLRRYSLGLLVLCVLSLVIVLTPLGSSLNGARSWFVIGPISVQPVEVAKIGLTLWGAHVLVIKRAMLHQWRHLLVPLVPVALLMFALVMLQPDLGTTITLGVIVLALLWFAGAPLRLFASLALGAVTGVMVLATIAGYRFARLTAFISPNADPQGSGLQARQALYALAEGGIVGKGLGQSSAKWSYLPNVYNDFIFAVIGEELGFLGCLVVLVLYGLTAYVGLRIAIRNTDPWIRLVAGTLTVWLVSQAAINVGYVVGLLPITGLPLPLISAGGTSVVTTMIVFGILANFARHEPEAISTLRTQGQGWFGKLLKLPMPAPYRPPARRRPARPSAPPKRANRAASTGRIDDVHPVDQRRGGRRATSGSATTTNDYRRRRARRRH